MKYLRITIGLLLIGIVTFATVKKVSPVSWGLWGATNTSSGLALRGYDVVSYFGRSSPVKGSEAITFEWRDAVWRFASEESRERFAANPMRYAPEFGGFCTYAVSKGFTADADPLVWHIEKDRLYVFMDENVRDDWVANIAGSSFENSYQNWATRD
jgi:hypothetical protein